MEIAVKQKISNISRNNGHICLVLLILDDISQVIEIHSENNFAVSEGETDFQILVLFCTKKHNF